MSSVCAVSDEPNIEDIKSGKFHLIFGSAENVLDKCSVDALKYSSCHLHNRLVAFVIDESHVIVPWISEPSTVNNKLKRRRLWNPG
jgi:superfamily II DNA helicase RecQ